MKLLIIPDIHGRTFWKDITTHYSPLCDKIVFLGDYLDPYQYYEDITRKQSMKNFDEIIKYKQENKDKVILLLGNHCLQYLTKHFITRARYDSSNAWHNANTYREHLSLFQLTYDTEINGKKYLFSHAGLMNSFAERHKQTIGEPTSENLNKLLHFDRGIEILCEISYYRTSAWYAQNTGSIVWSDVEERISDPDDGNVELYDYQIFGHTIQDEGQPIITDKWACLDCQRGFILDEENKLTML